MIIAVDGPTASGKGTLSSELAKRLGYHWLDSGALYRLVGLAATRQGLALDEAALRESDLLAFQIAIERGNPGSVMCAYNKVNGDWAKPRNLNSYFTATQLEYRDQLDPADHDVLQLLPALRVERDRYNFGMITSVEPRGSVGVMLLQRAQDAVQDKERGV